LHPDGKTLYFSSAGHNSLGGLDVYKSTRLNSDSWTEWSTPVNLGKEINTPGNDVGYKITTKGDRAYFSEDDRPGGYGGYDLYSLVLPKIVRPDRVATIRGKVVDSAGNPLEVTIRWENLETHKSAGQLRTDPKTGEYFIALPVGHTYGYYAEREGYFPVSRSIDLRNVKDADSIDLSQEDLSLVSLEEMKKRDLSIRINNVFFEYDKSDLEPESFPELDRLAKLLKSSPNFKIEIDGYTDSDGGDAYNQDLSERRAQAIVDYLVKVGCNSDKLIAHGFGKTKPLASNETEEGRALNRRVEFKVAKD
jgi:outer membrane protein OmpA-like peptidoglycan-associated protein